MVITSELLYALAAIVVIILALFAYLFGYYTGIQDAIDGKHHENNKRPPTGPTGWIG